MRILAFSDLHRNADAAKEILLASCDADVVVGAGDFATGGGGLEDTASILQELDVPAIFVPGNHDSLEELKTAFHGRRRIRVLHGDKVIIGGVEFFGLGFAIPPGEGSWDQGLDEEEAERLLSACPSDGVLVTHSPPFGIADTQRDGRHDGSLAIHNAIRVSAPRLHLCGHIHNAWGTSGMIGKCAVHNLGPTINWFSVT